MTFDKECPVCFEENNLEKLDCRHSICLECIRSIIDTQFYNKLSCPLCRNVSYEINNKDINTKIIDIEFNRYHDDNTFYIDLYRYYYYDCMYDYTTIDYKKETILRINPRKKLKIRNNNVIKETYS